MCRLLTAGGRDDISASSDISSYILLLTVACCLDSTSFDDRVDERDGNVDDGWNELPWGAVQRRMVMARRAGDMVIAKGRGV